MDAAPVAQVEQCPSEALLSFEQAVGVLSLLETSMISVWIIAHANPEADDPSAKLRGFLHEVTVGDAKFSKVSLNSDDWGVAVWRDEVERCIFDGGMLVFDCGTHRVEVFQP